MKHHLVAAVSLACALAATAFAALPAAEALIGKWHIGDGEGYNIDLTLHADYSYDAVWNGCLGIYGTAQGKWRLERSKLTFTPVKETDMMRKEHLRTLSVTSDKQQHAVLLPAKNTRYFKKWGSDPPYWCYVRADEATK